jgi:hypothetical protein
MPISTAKLANAASPIPTFNHPAVIAKNISVTFTSGSALSSAVDLRSPDLFGFHPIAITTPSAWTTARISVQMSYDGATWTDVHLWNTGEYATTGTALASQTHILDVYPLRGMPFVRFRSGVSASPVNQAADRVVTVICGTV